MNLLRIALRNIIGNPIKSMTIFFCVFGAAAFFITMSLIIRGAQYSLDKGLARLGADILVLPAGAESKVESALLMGKPTKVWMPASYLDRVAATRGVAVASPQLYLQSLYGASCCAVSEMFLVVYDPASDFTVSPWLKQNLGRGLAPGETVGGTYIFMPEGMKYLTLYGYDTTLKGNLEPTGTGLDQTLFLTLDTARTMAKSSLTTAVQPLEVPQDKISAVLVKAAKGADVHATALRIQLDLPDVVAVESPNLFGAFRKQVLGLLSGFLILSVVAWAIAGILIGLVFSMVTHERRREIAVFRAIGFTRMYVFRSVLFEALLLAAVAALSGMTVASLGIFTFREYISLTLQMPFLFPSLASLGGLYALALAVSLAVVAIAVFLPAYRASQQEPALAMRE